MSPEEKQQFDQMRKDLDDLKSTSIPKVAFNQLSNMVNSRNFSSIYIHDTPIRVSGQVSMQAGGKAAIFIGTGAFGVYYGSGVPTISASKGSLYLRSDGSSTSTRAYINTDGGTTWTNITTAA